MNNGSSTRFEQDQKNKPGQQQPPLLLGAMDNFMVFISANFWNGEYTFL